MLAKPNYSNRKQISSWPGSEAWVIVYKAVQENCGGNDEILSVSYCGGHVTEYTHRTHKSYALKKKEIEFFCVLITL